MLKTLHNSGRNFSILTCVLIACCILSSCKKDDKEDTPPPLPTLITVTTGSFVGNYTVLVTDSTGEILAKSPIEPNSSIELKSEKPYDKDNINVFYHTIYSNGDSKVQGYLKIKKGFVLDMFHDVNNNSDKLVQLHVKNGNTGFSNLRLATDVEFKEFTSLSDTANKMLMKYSPNRDIYVQVEKDGALFYKFYTVNQSTGVTIDISEINTPLAKKSISLPASTSYFSYYTMCKFDSKDERYYYLGFRVNQGNIIQNPYEFNLPPAGSFQYQRYSIMWNDYADITQSYGNNYINKIPDKFEPLKLSCDVVNSNTSQFKVAFNGEIDYYQTYFYLGNNTVDLVVPSSVNEFKLPDLGGIFNDPNLNMSAFKLRQISGLNILEFPKEDFLNNYVKSPDPVNQIYDSQMKIFSFTGSN